MAVSIPTNNVRDYMIAWVVTKATEKIAAEAMFDSVSPPPLDFYRESGDINTYSWGVVAQHRVVLAYLTAGELPYDRTITGVISQGLHASLGHIRVAVLLGTAAAIPREIPSAASIKSIRWDLQWRLGVIIAIVLFTVSIPSTGFWGILLSISGYSLMFLSHWLNYKETVNDIHVMRDIRRGDVLVSILPDGSSGLARYDPTNPKQPKGKDDSVHIDRLAGPPQVIIDSVRKWAASRTEDAPPELMPLIETVLENPELRELYSRPDPSTDRLFRLSCAHTGTAGCEDCKSSGQIKREPRPADGSVRVAQGGIFLSPVPLDTQAGRDIFLQWDNDNAVGAAGLGYEAAVLDTNFPCLAIRGISNYVDSHANDLWENAAAMSAAAYVKLLLRWVDADELSGTLTLREVLEIRREPAEKPAIP